MNIEDITLGKLAVACLLFDSLTPYNTSLGDFKSDTGERLDLTNTAHRRGLMDWLNDWGCRHLSKEYHNLASDSIQEWHQANSASLFTDEKPLWQLGDSDLEMAARAYGNLKDKPGAWRVRGGIRRQVHIGPTAASKVLFAIRPEALMPWDEAMRISFECDGSPESYSKYLMEIRDLTLHIGNLCGSKGFQIDDLPHKLGRPHSTVLSLVNEYIWITETRKVKPPSAETLMQWAALY